MKRMALTMLLICLMAMSGFPASALGAQINVREERLGDETVAFTRQYPRINGLNDAKAQDSINRQIRQQTYAQYLKIRQTAKQSNDTATGKVLAELIFQSDGLLCIEMTTDAKIGNHDEIRHTSYLNFSLKTGKKLYFWDLFIKDGAKRQAVTECFLRAAKAHGEPEPEWVLTKIASIDTCPFYFDRNNGTLCVDVNGGNGSLLLSVPLSELTLLFEPGLLS